MEKLFIAGIENIVFTGETFLKLLNKNIDDYKYQENRENWVRSMGSKVKKYCFLWLCGRYLS